MQQAPAAQRPAASARAKTCALKKTAIPRCPLARMLGQPVIKAARVLVSTLTLVYKGLARWLAGAAPSTLLFIVTLLRA